MLDQILQFVSNHAILVTGFCVVLFLLIQDLTESLTRKHNKISPLAAVKLINDSEPLIWDVRESQEFQDGHINGAQNVAIAQIAEKLEQIGSDKERPILVVCQSGTRAPAACKKLMTAGHANVFEISGGMLSWLDQKLPVSKNKTR